MVDVLRRAFRNPNIVCLENVTLIVTLISCVPDGLIANVIQVTNCWLTGRTVQVGWIFIACRKLFFVYCIPFSSLWFLPFFFYMRMKFVIWTSTLSFPQWLQTSMSATLTTDTASTFAKIRQEVISASATVDSLSTATGIHVTVSQMN